MDEKMKLYLCRDYMLYIEVESDVVDDDDGDKGSSQQKKSDWFMSTSGSSCFGHDEEIYRTHYIAL